MYVYVQSFSYRDYIRSCIGKKEKLQKHLYCWRGFSNIVRIQNAYIQKKKDTDRVIF